MGRTGSALLDGAFPWAERDINLVICRALAVEQRLGAVTEGAQTRCVDRDPGHFLSPWGPCFRNNTVVGPFILCFRPVFTRISAFSRLGALCRAQKKRAGRAGPSLGSGEKARKSSLGEGAKGKI